VPLDRRTSAHGSQHGVSGCQGNEAAQEGIARGSEKGDQRADRQTQQGAATDAHAVCNHVPEFHRAARREVLTRLHEDSQKEHREAWHKPTAAIPKSDHWQKCQGQISTEVLQFVPDVEAADRDHDGRCSGQQGADDDAADQHDRKGHKYDAFVPLSEHAVIHARLLPFPVGDTYDTMRLVESTS